VLTLSILNLLFLEIVDEVNLKLIALSLEKHQRLEYLPFASTTNGTTAHKAYKKL
jgi:hypothetical protein